MVVPGVRKDAWMRVSTSILTLLVPNILLNISASFVLLFVFFVNMRLTNSSIGFISSQIGLWRINQQQMLRVWWLPALL